MLLQVVRPNLLLLRLPLLLVLGVEATRVGVKASADLEKVSPLLMLVVVCCSGVALLSAELRYHIKW